MTMTWVGFLTTLQGWGFGDNGTKDLDSPAAEVPLQGLRRQTRGSFHFPPARSEFNSCLNGWQGTVTV